MFQLFFRVPRYFPFVTYHSVLGYCNYYYFFQIVYMFFEFTNLIILKRRLQIYDTNYQGISKFIFLNLSSNSIRSMLLILFPSLLILNHQKSSARFTAFSFLLEFIKVKISISNPDKELELNL